MNRKLRKLFIIGAYRSYGNLARLFMRLFAGLLFLQFGIRQMVDYDYFVTVFPEIWGMSSATVLTLMIIVELVFPILIVFGFFTRLAAVPPMISMIIAETVLFQGEMSEMLCNDASQSVVFASMPLGYVPLMFMGLFFFIVLAGPGKVSVDYLLTLYIANKNNLNELTTI